MEYTYSSYQVPYETRLPYYIWYWLWQTSLNNRQMLNTIANMLKEIGLPVANKFFGMRNVKLNKPNNGRNAYMCATRHLISMFTTYNENNDTTKRVMHFWNLQVVDMNQLEGYEQPFDGVPEEGVTYRKPDWTPAFVVHDIRAWKMSTDTVSNLQLFWDSGSLIGIRPVRNPRTYPVFGITQKKLVVPDASILLEGMHINIFEYPYVFLQNYKPSNDPDTSLAYVTNENWLTNAIKPVY